jgi:hypothetical protein
MQGPISQGIMVSVLRFQKCCGLLVFIVFTSPTTYLLLFNVVYCFVNRQAKQSAGSWRRVDQDLVVALGYYA